MSEKKLVTYKYGDTKFPFKNGDLVGYVCYPVNEKHSCMDYKGVKYYTVFIVIDAETFECLEVLDSYKSGFLNNSTVDSYYTLIPENLTFEDIYHKIE